MQRMQDTSSDKGLFFLKGAEEDSLKRISGSYRKIEREILNLFVQQEYQKLRMMLSVAPPKNKDAFFEKRGDSILYHAVADSNDTEALKIITENVSTTILKKLLRHNNFEILRGLVGIQYSLRTYTFSGQTEEEAVGKMALFSEKLQCLSRIDPELLTDFLEQHREEKYMLEPIIEVIKSSIPTKLKKELLSLRET